MYGIYSVVRWAAIVVPACPSPPLSPASLTCKWNGPRSRTAGYLSLIGFVYSTLTDRFQFWTEFARVYIIRYGNSNVQARYSKFDLIKKRVYISRIMASLSLLICHQNLLNLILQHFNGTFFLFCFKNIVKTKIYRYLRLSKDIASLHILSLKVGSTNP